MITRSKTSQMGCIVPALWGFEKVEQRFGQIVRPSSQSIVVTGELIRDLQTGKVFAFISRKNGCLQLKRFEL